MIGKYAALAVSGLLGAAAIAAGAQADWEYTRWGMTPEQVVAASSGAVRLGAPPEGRDYQGFVGRAVGVYRGGGASYHAFFHFDAANRLARVALERIDGTPCATLNAGMKARYGQPVRNNSTSFATIEEFHDRGGGNLVRFIQVGELPCTITFDRLR